MMDRLFKWYILSLFFYCQIVCCECAIFNETEEMGRFGDQAIAYFLGKWVSFQKKMPFFYKPIDHSEEFFLHTRENRYHSDFASQFDEVRTIESFEDISHEDDEKNILYRVGYTFNDSSWQRINNFELEFQEYFNIMFTAFKKEKSFFHEIKELIRPLRKPTFIDQNASGRNIAVHVRTGGSFEESEKFVFCGSKSAPMLQERIYPDKEVVELTYLRFLPLEWYAKQIMRIRKILRGYIVVYIFTDDNNPKEITQFLKKMVDGKNIHWVFREKGNSWDAHIAEDLWSMASCDYLIRPWSQFSRIAQFLGNHRMVIFPTKHVENEKKHIITTRIEKQRKKPHIQVTCIRKPLVHD